jgi:hypothetical protein
LYAGANHPPPARFSNSGGLEGFGAATRNSKPSLAAAKSTSEPRCTRLPDERYDLALNWPALLLKREYPPDLAWMLLVSERVDRRYAGITGKIPDVPIAFEHCSVDDSPSTRAVSLTGSPRPS